MKGYENVDFFHFFEKRYVSGFHEKEQHPYALLSISSPGTMGYMGTRLASNN